MIAIDTVQSLCHQPVVMPLQKGDQRPAEQLAARKAQAPCSAVRSAEQLVGKGDRGLHFAQYNICHTVLCGRLFAIASFSTGASTEDGQTMCLNDGALPADYHERQHESPYLIVRRIDHAFMRGRR